MPDRCFYSIDLHLEGLKLILTSSDSCGRCPAFELAKKMFPDKTRPNTVWINCTCDICFNFLDNYIATHTTENYPCPCGKYSKEKAFELTEQVLQKYFPKVWNEILIKQEKKDEYQM